MLRQALILSSNREYAQTMRSGLLKDGGERLVNVETDPLRAMQLTPLQYDLIILDATLDVMDGLQLLQFIKNQAPATKFVVVSDSHDEGARAVAYQSGADFFLERPHSPETYEVALQAIQGLFKQPGSATGPLPEDKSNPLVNLADIVQMHCLSGDSILLLVRGSSQHNGDIFIFRGEVYHAQYPGRGGENAFRDMLRWNNGRVRVKTIALRQAPPRTIEMSYRQLLGTLDQPEAVVPEVGQESGDLFVVASKAAPDTSELAVIKEAPPRESSPQPRIFFPDPALNPRGETQLPQVNSHWRVGLTGELLEGSQVADPDRCAFITTFIYRKMADVAVALEVEYFNSMTLFGPHLQQVLVADNLGVRHAVFDTPWTNEAMRAQFVKWCCEQSL